MKLYGLLDNRIAEGKNYTEDGLIHEGTDITMYLWSDRNCYYVTEVMDQKHIKVKRYVVVADKEKASGMGHQNWLYFKTRKECNKYLNQFSGDYDENPKEYEQEEWKFRYGKWQRVLYTEEYTGEPLDKPRYVDLSGKISFGVKDYHYDWEF